MLPELYLIRSFFYLQSPQLYQPIISNYKGYIDYEILSLPLKDSVQELPLTIYMMECSCRSQQISVVINNTCTIIFYK